MVSASHCVGFTLPGMIDEPGSFSGRISSPIPARGPEASQRMSLAIFINGAASVLSALGELGVRVEPGADRRSADREIVQIVERIAQPRQIAVELADVARELLAQ